MKGSADGKRRWAPSVYGEGQNGPFPTASQSAHATTNRHTTEPTTNAIRFRLAMSKVGTLLDVCLPPGIIDRRRLPAHRT